MTALEQSLLRVAGRSQPLRRAMQRWALRYSARMLRTLGPAHAASADVLQVLGAASRSVTQTGITSRVPRRPLVIPPLLSLHRDASPTRPYLVGDDPD